jgi:hypothetical protein
MATMDATKKKTGNNLRFIVWHSNALQISKLGVASSGRKASESESFMFT